MNTEDLSLSTCVSYDYMNQCLKPQVYKGAIPLPLPFQISINEQHLPSIPRPQHTYTHHHHEQQEQPQHPQHPETMSHFNYSGLHQLPASYHLPPVYTSRSSRRRRSHRHSQDRSEPVFMMEPPPFFGAPGPYGGAMPAPNVFDQITGSGSVLPAQLPMPAGFPQPPGFGAQFTQVYLQRGTNR